MLRMLCTTPYTIFMLSCKDGNGLSNYFLQKVVINLYHHVVLWYHLRQFSVSQLFFIMDAVTQTKDFNILKYLPCSLPGKGDQFFFLICVLNMDLFHLYKFWLHALRHRLQKCQSFIYRNFDYLCLSNLFY